jgi:hypothetical protein
MTQQRVSRRTLLGAALTAALGGVASAQNVELLTLRAQRNEGALALDFATRVVLPRAVEEALQRGVPVYFVAQATLLRYRWYWRDERVARVSRAWRLAYQPLTNTWRVGLGALTQSYPSLAEAMATVTRASQWRIIDLAALDSDSTYTLEFSWRLDTSQLPSPMQIGLGGQAGDFQLSVERSLRFDAAT